MMSLPCTYVEHVQHAQLPWTLRGRYTLKTRPSTTRSGSRLATLYYIALTLRSYPTSLAQVIGICCSTSRPLVQFPVRPQALAAGRARGAPARSGMSPAAALESSWLLLEFVSALERRLLVACEGSAVLPPPGAAAIAFFSVPKNRQVPPLPVILQRV